MVSLVTCKYCVGGLNGTMSSPLNARRSVRTGLCAIELNSSKSLSAEKPKTPSRCHSRPCICFTTSTTFCGRTSPQPPRAPSSNQRLVGPLGGGDGFQGPLAEAARELPQPLRMAHRRGAPPTPSSPPSRARGTHSLPIAAAPQTPARDAHLIALSVCQWPPNRSQGSKSPPAPPMPPVAEQTPYWEISPPAPPSESTSYRPQQSEQWDLSTGMVTGTGLGVIVIMGGILRRGRNTRPPHSHARTEQPHAGGIAIHVESVELPIRGAGETPMSYRSREWSEDSSSK